MRFRILFLTLAFSTLVGCRSEGEKANSESPVPVETAPVIERTLSAPIHTSGMLSSTANIKLGFKVGGIIEAIFVDEGAHVKSGQILARLDSTEINARVRQARSAFEKAQRDLARAKKLYEDEAVSLQQLQNATTAYEVAQSNLRIAEFNSRHAAVVAPSRGVILKRFVEPGEMIAPGYPVFLFAPQNDEWIIRCGLSDRDILKVSLGDSARIRFGAVPDKTFAGTVGEIAEAIDPVSGTFEVEIRLRRPGNRLVSGLVASVEIFPREKRRFKLIPLDALVEARGNEAFVFVPDASASRARKRKVRTGPILGEQVAIASGLEDVDRVITAGAVYLNEGAKIEITN